MSEAGSVELPRWQSHKQVFGDKIVEIRDRADDPLRSASDSRWQWVLEHGGVITVSHGLIARGAPVVGDYYVRYDDGYESWSPAKAFEEGYTLLRTSGRLESHAEYELRMAGWFDKDSSYGGLMGPAIMRLVKVFANEGHSGYSAPLAIDLFSQVARFEPLLPLSGEEGEWNQVAEDCWQNKRCSHVFKDAQGNAYDSEGRLFKSKKTGGVFATQNSRVPVTFPYTPRREIVEVESVEEAET